MQSAPGFGERLSQDYENSCWCCQVRFISSLWGWFCEPGHLEEDIYLLSEWKLTVYLQVALWDISPVSLVEIWPSDKVKLNTAAALFPGVLLPSLLDCSVSTQGFNYLFGYLIKSFAFSNFQKTFCVYLGWVFAYELGKSFSSGYLPERHVLSF